MKWFKPKTVVVEVEKTPSPIETPETLASIVALSGNSGFQWLLSKLRSQRARLQAELANAEHTSLTSVHNLQNGIFWTGWLERQLNWAKAQEPRDATLSEQAFFDQIAAQIEYVGRPQTPTP